MKSLDEYQIAAMRTAVYPQAVALQYSALGLCSEAGELAGKVKKAIRDDDGKVSTKREHELVCELGDVLWSVAAGADALGYDLSEIATVNIEKLRSRMERGKISGDGDSR